MLRKLKSKLLNVYLLLSGRALRLKKAIEIDYEWYGNDYGGFYVAKSRLDENSIVYSFGIGEDVSFDTAIIKKFNCKVYGFDPTPKSIAWVNAQTLPYNLKFEPYGIGINTGLVTFYLPKNPDYVSGSIKNLNSTNAADHVLVPLKTLSDIAKSLGHKTIDVLKMDIEGAEYEVIADILKTNIVIKQILVEFHHRMLDNGGEMTRRSIAVLKEHGFELFAFTNTLEELSFLNTRI